MMLLMNISGDGDGECYHDGDDDRGGDGNDDHSHTHLGGRSIHVGTPVLCPWTDFHSN